ncbi:MAG TPA: 2'-5' RNA ligase family protein, partial [Chitinophagaceae bacterium]
NEHLRQMQRDIVNSFRSFFPSISLTDKELEFHPHITVAYRDLDYRIFREAWEEYREKNFDADFEVDNFSLLQHDQKQWNIIATRVLE